MRGRDRTPGRELRSWDPSWAQGRQSPARKQWVLRAVGWEGGLGAGPG